jgi:hypothetical protein
MSLSEMKENIKIDQIFINKYKYNRSLVKYLSLHEESFDFEWKSNFIAKLKYFFLQQKVYKSLFIFGCFFYTKINNHGICVENHKYFEFY